MLRKIVSALALIAVGALTSFEISNQKLALGGSGYTPPNNVTGGPSTAATFHASATGCYDWATRSQICSPANGQLIFKNAAGTSGVIVDFTSDGVANFLDRSAGDTATVQSSILYGTVGLTLGGLQVKFGGTACTPVLQTLTFPANPGAATETTSGLVPAGVNLIGIDTWVHVAGTNCTSMSIGDGSVSDLWGHNVAITHGSQTTSANATANWAPQIPTASEVTITANGGNCFGLVVYVTANYCFDLAPSQD